MKQEAYRGNASAPAADTVTVTLDGDRADVVVGGNGRGGDIKVRNGDGIARIRLDAGGPEAVEATLKSSETVVLFGETATIQAGGYGQDGQLLLLKTFLDPAHPISGSPGVPTITMRAESGNIIAGGNGVDGDVILRGKDGQDAITLSAGTAVAYLGSAGNAGNVVMRDEAGRDAIALSAKGAVVNVGAFANPGTIRVRPDALGEGITLEGKNASLHVGGFANPGRIRVIDGDEKTRIELDGAKGEIVLTNGDCAEEFDRSPSAREADFEPGSIVVLDERGAVRPCAEEYDGCVAGVVSGAGDYRPALVLDRRPAGPPRVPVALVGKVFCKVDARYAPVHTGDLLTTSATLGHAMRASDRDRAFGAVLGKALLPLEEGCALIPVLVSLK
jgi:hypothetical protein